MLLEKKNKSKNESLDLCECENETTQNNVIEDMKLNPYISESLCIVASISDPVTCP